MVRAFSTFDIESLSESKQQFVDEFRDVAKRSYSAMINTVGAEIYAGCLINYRFQM
jgi:hypothetical protein